MSTIAEPTFCCSAASPVAPPFGLRLHHDPNRDLHESIFRSFIAFAIRQHEEVDRQIRAQEAYRLFMSALSPDSGPPTPDTFPCTPVSLSPMPPSRYSASTTTMPVSPPFGLAAALAPLQQELPPEPVLTEEALKINPLGPKTPYVVHLTSREDYGPVLSHRYFICPDNLSHDWIEISKIQWFAQGEPFKMKAEKWDLKCLKDSRFFRLTLRPNLALRGCYSIPTPVKQPSYPRANEGLSIFEKQHLMPTPVKHALYPIANEGLSIYEQGYMMPNLASYPSVDQISCPRGFDGSKDGGYAVPGLLSFLNPARVQHPGAVEGSRDKEYAVPSPLSFLNAEQVQYHGAIGDGKDGGYAAPSLLASLNAELVPYSKVDEGSKDEGCTVPIPVSFMNAERASCLVDDDGGKNDFDSVGEVRMDGWKD